MVASCSDPLPLYQPRDPQASDLWQLLDQHFDSFRQVYDQRYQPKYGFWRPVIDRSVAAFLQCGDLQQGFARIRCPDCHHEMFVAFSCKQRCTCPSCHQKRALVTAIHVAQEVCAPVAHRQVVLTIPKRLRVHTRFDRQLLGKLSSCAWNCLKAETGRLLGRKDVVPDGGLWEGSSARPPPPLGDPAHRDREVIACRSPGGPHELTYVDQDTFEAIF